MNDDQITMDKKCDVCTMPISSTWKHCPHCGSPTKEKYSNFPGKGLDNLLNNEI